MTTYSIIIPTRDRHLTLEHCLRSVLEFPEDDLEIIIADNCSTQETEVVVSQFSDHRIVYTRSHQRLSMTENFERGLEISQGQFVTILGDDDFIVPSVWHFIKERLHKTGLVNWFRYPYFWPEFPEPSAGFLYAEVSRMITNQSSADMLISVINNFLNYQYLPSFYNSWVSRDLINKLIACNRNIFGKDCIYPPNVLSPDVFSSLQLLLISQEFDFSTLPFSISGISQFSNGMGLNHNNRDSQSFIKEYGYKSRSEAVNHRLSKLVKISEEFFSNLITTLVIASDYFLFFDIYKQLICSQISEHCLLASLIKRIQAMETMPKEIIDDFIQNSKLDSSLLENDDIAARFDFATFYKVKSACQIIDTREWGAENCYDAMHLYESILLYENIISNQIFID